MDFKDLKQHVKELMTAMGRSGIKRLALKHQELEIELERAEPLAPGMIPAEAMPVSPLTLNTRPFPSSMASEPKEGPAGAAAREESSATVIASPMVGTFYAAASPETAPFVKIGDTVAKDDVVCIIEAMKVMNEIKSGVSGTVTEVLVASGDPVEFGTKLFRIR